MSDKTVANILAGTADQVVYAGFTHRQLTVALDRVTDPEDWKAPIWCFVTVKDAAEVGLIGAAIDFFTATKPVITTIVAIGGGKDGKGVFLFEAQGYRAGPAGDH